MMTSRHGLTGTQQTAETRLSKGRLQRSSSDGHVTVMLGDGDSAQLRVISQMSLKTPKSGAKKTLFIPV